MIQAEFLFTSFFIILLSACAVDTSENSQTSDADQQGYAIDPTTGAAISTTAPTSVYANDTSAVSGFWDDSSWDGTFFERYLHLTADGQWQDFERRDFNNGQNCLDSRQGTLTRINETTYKMSRGSGFSLIVNLEVTSNGLSWKPADGQNNRVIPRAFFGVSDVQACNN